MRWAVRLLDLNENVAERETNCGKDPRIFGAKGSHYMETEDVAGEGGELLKNVNEEK